MKSDSLSAIFHRVQSRMRAVGLSLLKYNDETDDAIQETFYRIWAQRETIDETANVENLALVIFRNICIDYLRKKRNHIDIGDISVSDEPAMLDYEIEDYDTLYNDVMNIINSELTPAQQQIIRMRDIENRSYSEIAKLLGMEEATVRVNLSRARKSVRNIYLKHRI